ncbi:DUF4349 domain-containing protein [Lentibacter algarum]|uniref:DUF4349 domain-containing protein n=1 Tax=Lentibacter algarum TaxID=576131 RepID=UPI001C09E444|nr:DUF4349 domain-containing protein [Lentibacter algarum]MBU2983233.1 DUF4349 domain-containing protein [Lentibacter algarum]
MKSVFARRLGVFLIGFLLMFLFRLGYGYMTQPNGEVVSTGAFYQQVNSSFELSRKNYAGQKKAIGVGPASVDQRYEKVATLGLVSEMFDEDEAELRRIAKSVKALVQHEQAFGLAGQRHLQIALGVNPDHFDAVIEQLRAIGQPVSFQVNKTDKTNEYRELLARRESLEKSRDNLVTLKSREAELADLIALETRILDLESQIQSLGVSVGEFDSEFEFVTIKLTMREVPAAKVREIGLMTRSKVALEWAVKYYFLLIGAFFMFACASFLSILAMRWLKALAGDGDSKA